MMCNNTKTNKHFGTSTKLCTFAQFSQVAHDQVGHVLQKVDLIVTDSASWFVVKNTVSSDAGSTWRFDWNTSIKACIGSLCYVWPVTEPLIFEEIVDDMDLAGILVVAIGSFVPFWDVDSVFTN